MARLRALLRPHVAPLVYAQAVGLPTAITLLGAHFAMPAFVFEHIMVLLVVVLAVTGGRAPAVVAAITGTIGDNMLLRDPIGRPAITGVRDTIDLGLFLIVAVVVGWLMDRTQQARARAVEAAERERIAREELDRLVATVTHDLATPLTAIQGTIQFARRHSTLPEVDVMRLLARVETATARATSLLRSLSDSRSLAEDQLALQRRRVDLREIVEPLVTMLDRTSDRHPIVLHMSDGPLVIDGDPERLGRVVENLISNAIKYSPSGGAVEVNLHADGPWVMLQVRDHGIGIPADECPRLFALGYRSPQAAQVAPGLGLGLYITAEVIRRHDGSITVGQADGGGSCFTVRLPLSFTAELREPGGARRSYLHGGRVALSSSDGEHRQHAPPGTARRAVATAGARGAHEDPTAAARGD